MSATNQAIKHRVDYHPPGFNQPMTEDDKDSLRKQAVQLASRLKTIAKELNAQVNVQSLFIIVCVFGPAEELQKLPIQVEGFSFEKGLLRKDSKS